MVMVTSPPLSSEPGLRPARPWFPAWPSPPHWWCGPRSRRRRSRASRRRLRRRRRGARGVRRSRAAVSDGFVRKAAAVSGDAAKVLTASAGLARDKGLRGAVRKHLRAEDDLLAAVHAGVEQFVTVFTGMGGLMAERVTDLRDIELRIIAHLVGEPEPGVPSPAAVRPGRRGPRPRRHRGSRPGAGRRAGHRAGRPDQPHRDHRPPARHPVRGRRRRRDDARDRTRAPRRRHRGHHRDRPGRGAADARVAADRAARARSRPGPGPGATADGEPVKLLANVADGESARVRRRGAGRGRRAVPHRAELPRPQGRAVRRGAGRHLRRGAGRVRAAATVRRRPHPRRRLGQAGRLRDPRGRGEPRPRRPRAAAVLREPRAARPPARRASRRRPRRPAPRPG